jgi:hypothetical protein
VLVNAVVLSFILMAAAASLVTNAFYRHAAERSRVEQGRAEQIAESGAGVAYYELQAGADVTGDALGAAEADCAGGHYQTNIVPAYAGVGTYTLTTVATYGSQRQTLEMVVRATRPPAGFVGLNKITITGGASIDSYDSSLGSYASQVSGGHAGSLAILMTNGSIVTSGGGTIYGDAHPGMTGTYSGAVSVTGSTSPATTPVTVAPYAYSPPATPAPAWIGAGLLTSGVYHYSSLSLSGGKVLTLSGDVTIYCDKTFSISGGASIVVTPGSKVVVHHGSLDATLSGNGVVNLNQKAESFAFWSASTTKVAVSGSSAYYGTVYAPNADVISTGGSGLYGAATGKTLTLSSANGWLHYDDSLGLNDPDFELLMVRGW